MALEEKDPEILKLNVLLVLLQHPEGVEFGDFSGAFYKLHGCHPKFSFYGYSSLKQLVAGMKDLVVVEGSSQRPVLKLAKGFRLWLEDRNGSESSQEEPQCLIDEEKAEQQSGLADVLEALTRCLADYSLDLRIKKLQKFPSAEDGVDLEKLRISQGYKDTLEFLESQLPELNIQCWENRSNCVIPNSALSDVLTALTNLLGKYKSGLKVQNSQEFLLLREGIDLEKFSINQGYKDTLEFLEDKMPQLKIQYRKNRLKCVVQLTADVSDSSASSSIQNQVEELTSQPPDACSPAPSLDSDFSAYSSNTTSSGLMIQNSVGTSSPAPHLDSSFSACNTDDVPDKLMGTMSVALANVLAAVTSLLIESQFGMRLKKLRKLLRRRNGIDLEKFSIGQGYKDTLELLEDQMPELNIRYHEKRRECIIQLTTDAYSPVPSLDSDLAACSSDTTSSGPTRQKSDITAALVPILSVLRDHPHGLTVKTMEEDLKEKHGFNLQTFSREMGYKEVISFLLTIPGVCFAFTNDKHPHESVVQLLSGSLDPTHLPLGTGASKTLLSTETNIPHLLMETRPALPPFHSSNPSQFNAPVSSDLKQPTNKSKSLIQNSSEKKQDHHTGSSQNQLKTQSLNEKQQKRKKGRKPKSFGDNTKSLNPFCDTSVSKPQDQSLPVPAPSISPAVDTGLHTSMSMPCSPSFEKACSTSSPKVLDSSELLCPIPVQQPSASPPDRVSYKCDAEQPRKSSLTEDPPSKDLELKHQVAHILAAHPEGMSLFHFRSAYSAMYQQYLPLGNASSVKQRLLEMPDVVHLKGCGVQTLLLPVSSASPVKTGQTVSSMVPGRTLSPATTMIEPAMALKSSPVCKVAGMPQHCPIPLQVPEYRMPGVKERCILPGEQTPRALKTTNPWQEHQRARVSAEDISGQPDLFGVRIARVEPGRSLPTTSLPVTQKTAVMPKPPPHPSLLQKSPTPAECTQMYVRTDPKPAYTPFPPQPLIAFPTDSQAIRLNEHFKNSGRLPQSTFLTDPWRPHNSTPVPLASQQVPTNLWAQPVVYQPITLLPAVPNIPSIYPTPFFPAPGNPSGIQLQKTALQSQLSVASVAPRKLAQMTSPTHSTEQWTCIPAVPQPNAISQVQNPPRTLQCSSGLSSSGHPLVSSPFQNTTSFRSPKSETVRQPECPNHSLQDGQQSVSLPVAEEKLPDGTLKRVTSELSSSRDPRQCHDADSLVTSTSMLSLSPPPTVASLPPTYTSSNIKERSDPSLEPLTFRNQPKPTSRSTATLTSGTRPSCSSFLEPTTSPHHQPLHPLSSTTSNVSEVLSSEPQSFVHCQSYTSASAAVTMSTTCLSNSPPHSAVSTTSSFHQPSNDPLGIGIDFDVSDKMDVTPTVFKQAGSRSVPLLRNQTSYASSPQASPPPRRADKCVIL